MTSIESRGAVVPNPAGPPPHRLKPLKRTNRQKEAAKNEALKSYRDELPYLAPAETFEYRNSYFETLCTKILADGYHRTFTEIFHLIKLQRRQREEAGPDSMLSQIPPLEQEIEKLKSMSRFLMVAENSERKSDHLAAYESYLQLAQYFEEDAHDKWLSDHYYDRCLRSGPLIEGDGGRKLAEAHHNIGVAMRRGGQLESAIEHFEEFRSLTAGKDDWLQKDGKTLHRAACENLTDTLIQRSEQLQQSAEAKDLLQNAYAISKESGNVLLQAKCASHLGNAFDRIHKPDTALHFYKEFYQLATQLDDAEQLGLSCEALAIAYEKKGDTEKSTEYLQQFAAVTEGKEDKLFSKACRALGAAFNKKGDYQKAADYFSKAFSVARTLQDKEDIYLTRMQFGISQAFSFLTSYNEQLSQATPMSLANLLKWKDERKNEELKKPISDCPPCSLAARKPIARRVPPHLAARLQSDLANQSAQKEEAEEVEVQAKPEEGVVEERKEEGEGEGKEEEEEE